MSAGHDTAWATADHAQVRDVMSNKAVIAQLARTRRKSDDYDLPYLAGYSKDGSIIYFDRHLPEKLKAAGKPFKPRFFIELHEEVEKSIIDALGLTYESAHEIANALERRAVLSAGLNWDAYEKAIAPYIKADEHERIESIPPDLDWTPYLSPPVDRKLIARMKAAEDDGKLAKDDRTVNYDDDRGKASRHCGPDKEWPEGYCQMYGHFSCSEVAGYISPKGGCDLYVRARD